MILSDVTSGNRISINANEHSTPISGRNDAQATLSALKVGDSIQAKVVSREGDNVRLQLDGNKFVDAKMSSGINVETGKEIVFEVRGTSSGITLSPLFTNTSSDPNISKALSMAGLPLTSDTVTMTKSMMQAGMSIDRASLTNMFRDISAFNSSSVADIVDLHRLGITVNEANLEQIGSYKNLSYQLGEGMNDVAGKLTELVDNLIKDSVGTGSDTNTEALINASKVFDGMLSVASEYDWDVLGTAEDVLNQAEMANANAAINIASNTEGMSAAERALMLLGAKAEDNSVNATAVNESADNATEAANGAVINELTPESAGALKNEILSLVDSLRKEGIVEGTATDISNVVTETIKNSESAGDALNLLKNTLEKAIAEGDTKTLSKIMNNPVIKDNVLAAMKAQWNITPADVADKENVKEMYSRLQRQIGTINESLDAAGMKDTAAGNAAGNMGNNLDFLNQVNQMYAYIQLPLKLSTGDDAHGDLYVYSNGKKMSNNDGKVTALLHLDMEHLGPLDVYVAMDSSGFDKKVSTQFSVADDSILDFLEMHIDELTKRLEDKGYSCTARMSIKGSDNPDEAESVKQGIEPVIDMTGKMKLAEYSFDVRT